MRILMVNKYLYPRAGAETYMFSLANGLKGRGDDIFYFGMDHPSLEGREDVVAFPLIELGVQAGHFKKVEAVSRILSDRAFSRAQKLLYEAIEKFKPDLIHAHNVYNQISPSIFKDVVKHIPVVMTVHDYKPVCPSYNLFTKGKTCTKCLDGNFVHCITNQCVQNSYIKSTLAAASSAYHRVAGTYKHGYTHYIAPSNFMKKQLVRGGLSSEKITTVYNFVPTVENQTRPGESVLYAGRLSKEKGIENLIKAYSMLSVPRPPLKIAGEGPLKSHLVEEVERRGLHEVEWLGFLSPKQVKEEIQQSAVTVVPSMWFENCSIAILESLAMARPPIVSDMGGNPEIVSHKQTGWVYQHDDVSSLKKAIEELTANRATLEQLSQQAFVDSKERFGIEQHLTQVSEVYAKAIDAKSH